MNLSDIVLPVHLLILAFIAWTIFQADHMGFDWMRGKIQTLSAGRVRKLHYQTWYGLIGMIVTGLLLFWPAREYLLTRPEFYAKMAFIAGLIVNGFVIDKLQSVAVTRTFKELKHRERLPLLISGAISTTCWLGAFVMAFFLF